MGKINIGDVFSKLVVTGFTYGVRSSGLKKKLNTCACECGSIINVESGNLNSGNTKQCNSCAILTRGENRKTHGYANHANLSEVKRKTYFTWVAMKARCNNPKVKRYESYGGRGISVCESWDDFGKFLADMGEPPTRNHSIERIDNEGNYTPENCKWADIFEQANNKRSNHVITVNGESKNLNQWANETGIKRETIARRIKRGWTPERAVSELANGRPDKYKTPLGLFESLPSAAKAHSIAVSTLYRRITSKVFDEWYQL